MTLRRCWLVGGDPHGWSHCRLLMSDNRPQLVATRQQGPFRGKLDHSDRQYLCLVHGLKLNVLIEWFFFSSSQFRRNGPIVYLDVSRGILDRDEVTPSVVRSWLSDEAHQVY